MTFPKGFFVTGTDTDVGKTWSTVALMRALQARGLAVAGMKPVAAGCQWQEGGWKNSDALLLQQHASRVFNYRSINPYAFEQAVSPHVASRGQDVEIAVVLEACKRLMADVDIVLVEGAGGWLSPIDRKLTNADLAISLGLPVIMIIGMRLGCLNHALLTWQAVRQSGLTCAGWLAVTLDRQMPAFEENVDYLLAAIEAPCLGVLAYQERPDFDLLANAVHLEIWDEIDLDQNLIVRS